MKNATTTATTTVYGPAGAMIVPVEPTTKPKGKGPKVTAVAAPEAPAMPKAGKGEPKAAEAPKAAEGMTKAEAKAEGIVVLSDAMKAAEANVIAKATAVEGGAREAAVAIAEANATGLPRAYGISLAAWVVRCLTGAGLAKATVYYLKDIGNATAAIGTERAAKFPMEGLRAIASAAKGEPAKIRDMADVAQDGNEETKPSLDACRKAAKQVSGDEPESESVMIDRLYKFAMKMTKDDGLAAAALLAKAASKAEAMEAKRQEAEAMAEAKGGKA